MLGLIVVFNWERLFPGAQPDNVPVLPENSVILTLQIDQVVFERVGSAWRTNSQNTSVAMTSDDIQQLVDNWSRATMRWPSEEVNTTELFPHDHVVSTFLAGQKNGLVFGIKRLGNTIYLIHDGRYFELDFPRISQLVPPELSQ